VCVERGRGVTVQLLQVMKAGAGNYLANLTLYPGRIEFTSYLPENLQGVAVQPLGEVWADWGLLAAGMFEFASSLTGPFVWCRREFCWQELTCSAGLVAWIRHGWQR
jgi:Cofactor assembly of complex C subunit B, CCB2/CCB4